MARRSMELISFEGELRALCEKHCCVLRRYGESVLEVAFHDADTQVYDPLEDVTLVEDRL